MVILVREIHGFNARVFINFVVIEVNKICEVLGFIGYSPKIEAR